jgi:cysteine desulfurase
MNDVAKRTDGRNQPKLPIYLDYQSTTPTDPRVLAAMLPYFTEKFGNQHSTSHSHGKEVAEAVEAARHQVARLIGADERDIVFTSGATESNNLAIKGALRFKGETRRRVVTYVTEHKCVLESVRRLGEEGVEVVLLPVRPDGLVDLVLLARTLDERPTTLVSVMAANNEIGVVQPLAEIGALCRARGVLFHSDAAQAVGKVPIDVEGMNIDLLSLSAHKMYGPKGVGALYVRKQSPRVRLEPQIDGGGHERGLRSGTLNVPGIVGMGLACRLCAQEMDDESVRLMALRERLRQGILGQLEGVRLNGHATRRLPGNLNLSFEWIRGEALLMGLRGVAVSSGSACTSANPEPSYVLRALGLNEELAHGSLRFGLGRFNSADEIEYVIAEVVRVVRHLREMSPLYQMHRQGMAV